MKTSSIFPSNYVKASDLNGREVPVVIAKAKIEKLGSDNRLVLYFQNTEKGMVCNKTNAGRIEKMYGDDTDGWIGKEIVLYADLVEYQGKTVDAIRVKPPVKRAAPQRQAPQQPRQQQQTIKDVDDDMNDSIPF